MVKQDGGRSKVGEDHSRRSERCVRGPRVEGTLYCKGIERRPVVPDEPGSWAVVRPCGTDLTRHVNNLFFILRATMS